MVTERVREWPGITSVETNPITGSVLVYFTDPATALAKANESELFTLAESEPSGPNQPIATLTRRKVRSFDSRLRSLTSGAGDTRSVVFITLCAAGAYQLLRGNVAVPAFTYLWYAGDLLRLWHGAPKHDGSRAASDQ